MNTLSSSPLLASRDYVAGQVSDLADKLEQAESGLQQHGRMGGGHMFGGGDRGKKGEETALGRVTRDCCKLAVQQVQGLTSQVVKSILFNRSVLPGAPAASAGGAGSEQLSLSSIPMPGEAL